jgi:hypothetical protein
MRYFLLVRLNNTAALRAHGLEGSRFCALQDLAAGAELRRPEPQQSQLAGGSREQPSVIFLQTTLFRSGSTRSTDRPASSWVVPGSRLLPSYRTATLQSGSPPSAGRLRRDWDRFQGTSRERSQEPPVCRAPPSSCNRHTTVSTIGKNCELTRP